MLRPITLRLGAASDATTIGAMSRDLIEAGLGWKWTPQRIGQQIRRRDSNVLVACEGDRPVGFAIMQYRQDSAHLLLLAVRRCYQRRGIGRMMLNWQHAAADVAGIATIQLEVREHNHEARRFYQALGYEDVIRLPNYYRGRETAVRMARFLRMSGPLADCVAASTAPVPGPDSGD